MVKKCNVLLKIHNKSGLPMSYHSEWYKAGRVADGFSWPNKIEDGNDAIILNYESDWSLTGCSGYVTYQIGGTNVTIAFSNPFMGYNKLNVGTKSLDTWNTMGSPYDEVVEQIGIGSSVLYVTFQCTGGDVNTAVVTIKDAA